MGKDAMLEYIETLRKRYIQSTKIEKNTILSEFCVTSQYDRKYAIKLLGGKVPGRTKQSGPKAVYDSLHRVKPMLSSSSEYSFTKQLNALTRCTTLYLPENSFKRSWKL